MKPGKIILTTALASLLFAACKNANNNNNDNGDMYNNNNTSTMDTAAVNNNSYMNNNNSMSNGSLSADAADFMREAASGGMMEIANGKLAQQNSTSADVQAMGKMLVADHTEGNEKLMAIAKQKGVSMPDSMMDKDHDQYEKLADLKGRDFDQKFAAQSVDVHKDVIDKLTSESKTITDPDLLNWIKTTLPVLQKHLTHANMLDKKYNK